MPIGLSSLCPFLSPHSIFIPLQTCFNFPSFCVAPSLSLSLLPFSSCHVCSILRSLLYAVAPLAYTSSPSLSVFLSSFFLPVTFTAPIRDLFVTRWCIFPRLFTFNILLVSHPILLLYSWQYSVGVRCVSFTPPAFPNNRLVPHGSPCSQTNRMRKPISCFNKFLLMDIMHGRWRK